MEYSVYRIKILDIKGFGRTIHEQLGYKLSQSYQKNEGEILTVVGVTSVFHLSEQQLAPKRWALHAFKRGISSQLNLNTKDPKLNHYGNQAT